MTFKKYPKIHRLGKDETIGILEGTCYVQEKIDGANVSIWLDKRGSITCGSRNRELDEGFNGFVDWVDECEDLSIFFKDYPTQRLYGEWLVKHTIAYNETSYRQFYLFDVTEVKDGEENEDFMNPMEVAYTAQNYGFKSPQVFGKFENPTVGQLQEFVGKSELGDKGEGIVIKNMDFRDKYGNHNYAKIVTQRFKEDNGITFGGNNKFSDTYWEMYIVNKYMTLPRIEKIMTKLQPIIEEKLDLQHTPRIAGTAYHDMLTEEIWEIAGKVGTIDFKALKKLTTRKAIQIYKDIINDTIGVADRVN